jgi:hypothetical protein
MSAQRTFLFILGFLFLLSQSACGAQVSIEPTTTATFTKTPNPIKTLTPTSTPTLGASLTSSPTVDSTQQTWHATAVAIQTAERLESMQSWDAKETQIAQFPTTCDDLNFYSSKISPDGQWFAASCGYKRNQTLRVLSIDGIKWVLDFEDFLSPESPDGISGALNPEFWSPEGNYLYFRIELGYSGGGNDCFPRERGAYGLFRLNLANGSWATVIPSTNSFPGYDIKFSPTGRRYAITLNGVIITDLQTGESTKMATNGTVEKLSWSPDGKQLAYSTASCDDEKVQSSSVYIWDSTTNQVQILLEMDEIILTPELWVDTSTLRIIGEEIKGLDSFYTIYEYSIEPQKLLFTGTATPNP